MGTLRGKSEEIVEWDHRSKDIYSVKETIFKEKTVRMISGKEELSPIGSF